MKNITQFLNEVKIELTKVQWPKFGEFVGSTIVSLILICFFSIYLGAVDFVLSKIAHQMYGMW